MIDNNGKMPKAEKLKDCYNNNNVIIGYNYYVNLLTEKALGMYKYNNCPESLPQEQIERRLILDGFCVVFNKNPWGLVTAPASIYGEDIYYLPTNATYTQVKIGSGELAVGKNCVVIYNSQVDMYSKVGLRDLIGRYARLLADVDSSVSNMIVNTRRQKMGLAKSGNAAKALREFIDSMYAGEPAEIKTQTFIEMIKTVDWNDSTQSGRNIADLIASKQKILADFLQEIGVKTAFEKAERLITSEVSANDQLLTINKEDMLYCRQKGIERVNDMFGTNITVIENPAYKIKNVEVASNDDK